MKKIIFNVNNVNTELKNIDDEVIVFNSEGEFHYFKGENHREDGPAAITKDYSSWMKNGLISRDEKDGPAVIRNKIVTNFYHNSSIYFPSEYQYEVDLDEFQQIEYWKDGKLHRDNDPAIIITFKINSIPYKFEYWFKNAIPFNKENEYSSVGYKNNKIIFYQYRNKKGLLHRDGDKPAYENLEISIFYKNGIEHRDGDLPSYKSKILSKWSRAGVLHRLNKPAVIEYYYIGDEFGVGFVKCEKYYYENKLHRIDGPSEIRYDTNGHPTSKSYYIKGNEISKFKFFLKIFFKQW